MNSSFRFRSRAGSRTQESEDRSQSSSQDAITLPRFIHLMAELGVPGPRQRGRLGLESSFYTSLGEGAQFQAYKHTEVELVAKRVTLSNMMASNSQRLLDLELEIRALANEKIYEHPNIVDLLDWGYDIVHEIPQGILNPLNVKSPLLVPVLYVEPASEGSLEKFLDKCLDWTIRARLCLDIAAGLECLRECRILHNDLKPENILIFGDVNDLSSIQAKLADFGHSVASDENMDLTFHEYGKTESWLPPESRDYHPDLYQVCNGDLLFKSESYAYGMLALYTLFSTPERSSSLPFDHDRMIRKTEISNCLEANQLHTQGEDISEAWASIEEKFLGEQPEHRNDVSPSALDFSDTILNAWTLSRTELSGRQDQHNGPRRLPLLVNAGWNFYRKMTITLLNLLSEQASTGLQDYSGDLLFGMALGKAISGGKGFHKELKKLMHEAALGSQPSVRAMGVLRMIDAAIPSENPEGDGNISHTNLYEVAASGSITALSDLQNSNPGNAAESRAEFRRRGGYNRESAFASTFTCDEIRQMIITATQSDEPTVPVELTFKAKPGISHSGPDEAQDSLLHLAAAFGVSEAITRLTSDKHLGPGLDARNTEDETPLYKACMAGQYEAAQTLLHLGADSSVSVGRTSVTCLHWLFVFDASHMDRIASALISRGLSVDARVIPSVHYPGQDVIVFEEMVHYPFHRPIGTALHWAAHMESVDAVSHLLNNGACVDGLDEANVPDDGQSQTQKVKKQQSQTALSMAMYRGNPKMANYLLSRGANPSRTDGEGRTPLHMLAGDCWMQNRLFPIPLNMDQWCFHGSFNSCVEALATCVEAAKERGASLDTRRKDRNLTPLMDAVQSKNVCAVIALLNAGADANSCQDWSRNLPIHVWLTVEPDALAYPEGYFVALQKLLDSTTDIKRSHTAVTSLVLTNYSSHWKQKLVAILDHRHKIDINMRDESGMSLLMTWISLGIPNLNYLEGVAWLLTKGADITTKDKFGRDFLLYAAENFEIGDQDCLAILKTYLNHFATIPKNRVLNDCKDDHSGKSVLMALCQNCYIESVRHAIQNGIDVNHFDKNGRTALDITLESGNKMRLGLLSGYMIHHAGGQLPKTSDIKDADWHQAGFGDTHNESQSSQNNTTAMRDRYMTFPRLRVLLVEAGAKTGKQLGHRTTAPDIKQSERDLVEEFALEDFDPEIQPFYELWKDAYQYDDETEEEDAEWRSSQKGWSIPDVFRSKAIPPEAKGRAQ